MSGWGTPPDIFLTFLGHFKCQKNVPNMSKKCLSDFRRLGKCQKDVGANSGVWTNVLGLFGPRAALCRNAPGPFLWGLGSLNKCWYSRKFIVHLGLILCHMRPCVVNMGQGCHKYGTVAHFGGDGGAGDLKGGERLHERKRLIRNDFVYSQGREHPCPKTMLPSLDTIHCSRSRQSSPKTLPDDHKYATKAHKWPPRESQTLPQQLKIGCAFKKPAAENVFCQAATTNTQNTCMSWKQSCNTYIWTSASQQWKARIGTNCCTIQ